MDKMFANQPLNFSLPFASNAKIPKYLYYHSWKQKSFINQHVSQREKHMQKFIFVNEMGNGKNIAFNEFLQHFQLERPQNFLQ